MSFRPCSSRVGTLGANLLRTAPVVANSRHLPAATCWMNSPTGPDTAWI
jgi:hypothetical protein